MCHTCTYTHTYVPYCMELYRTVVENLLQTSELQAIRSFQIVSSSSMKLARTKAVHFYPGQYQLGCSHSLQNKV
jgi:hypothetical protein